MQNLIKRTVAIASCLVLFFGTAVSPFAKTAQNKDCVKEAENRIENQIAENKTENRIENIRLTKEPTNIKEVSTTKEDSYIEETKDVYVEVSNGPLVPKEAEIWDGVEAIKDVPNEEEDCRSDFITREDYTLITCKSSYQYKFQQVCDTDEDTGIRTYDGRYLIAMGSYYTHSVGQYVDIVFENGDSLPCIIGDCKADEHTDETNRYHANDGSVIEFIIDKEYHHNKKQLMLIVDKDTKIDKVVIYEEHAEY